MSEFIDIEDGAHSSVGASSAHRWMNCSGSNQLIAKLDPAEVKKSGAAAALGTAAHAVLAKSLDNAVEPWEYTGEIIQVEGWSGFPVDENMVSAVTRAYHHLDGLIVKHWRDEPEIFVEHKIQHPNYPDLFSTLDFGLFLRKVKKLIIADYKHGEGVNVEPTGPQLKYYAVVLLVDVFRGIPLVELMEFDIELHIMQPRQPHPHGPIRVYNTSVKELFEWFEDELLPAYEATKDPNALLKIGEWCRFCPARDLCPALKREALAVNTDLEPEVMTAEELAELLDKTDAIKRYLDKLEDVAFKRVLRGEHIPGRKLVKKRANRIWKSVITVKDGDEDRQIKLEDAIIEKFGEEAYKPRTLKGPPDIEKVDGGNKFVSRWAYTPDNGYTLAPESDKRTAVKPLLDSFMDRVDAAVETSEEVPEDV